MATGNSNEIVPPLKADNGSWAISAQDKANLLASTFEKKAQLPEEESNRFSDIFPMVDAI